MQWIELTIKTIQTINAEDNTEALLAEATYIINNVDEFLIEDEYKVAA